MLPKDKRAKKRDGEKLITELISYGRSQMKEKNIRVTGGDLIRLAQLREEKETETVREVEVKWVEELKKDDANKK